MTLSFVETMPSKRTFAKRLAALVTTGLGVSRPLEALTGEPPPAGTLAVTAPGSDIHPSTDGSASEPAVGSRRPRSAVANGTYAPAAVTSRSVDSVITARADTDPVADLGVPGAIAAPLRDILSRYDGLAPDRLRRGAGGAVLTPAGPAGCGVVVGDLNARTLRAELAADPDVTREPTDGSGFGRFRSEQSPVALAVRDDELVVAYGPSTTSAVTHRDAGLDTDTTTQTRSPADYGPLPSLLRGDATVCVDLGPSVRERLRETLANAPDALHTAVEASAAVGVTCTAASDTSSRQSQSRRHRDAAEPTVSLRYGAVADPRRLDRDTADAIASAARSGDSSFADADVSWHGRTVTIDVTATDGVVAPHAALAGVEPADLEPVSRP